MPAQSHIALITGASRGLGAEVARHLAHAGAHVIVNHRDRADEANTVVDNIRETGGQASALAAGGIDETAVAAMIDEVQRTFGHLDTLVLNAATCSDDTKEAKRYALRRLVEAALPLMAPGARIVFVTSNQAHFYPNKGVLKGYLPIAASKRADETSLYAMRRELDRRGIRCTVVSGDFVDTTHDDDAIAAYGPMPKHDPAVAEFAAAVARAAVEPHPLSIVFAAGHVLPEPGAPDPTIEQLAYWHAASAPAHAMADFAKVS